MHAHACAAGWQPSYEMEKTVPRCRVCAQPASKLTCVKCKTAYCSVACQTVDWKERDHKKECKRLVKANAASAAKGTKGADDASSRDEAWTPLPPLPPPPKPKAAPPVVDGPVRRRRDVERARVAAAAATAVTAHAPEPEHWLGTPRCPVCLEDWDVNVTTTVVPCCCKEVCKLCTQKLLHFPCPLCRTRLPESAEETLAMLRRNAEKGKPTAIRHLGNSYGCGGLGLVPSYKKAARLWQRAADLGDVFAMFNFACCCAKGNGVKLDVKKAVKYCQMAADLGYASAQYMMGQCYDYGEGVAQDDAEAVRLYKLAAEQGYTHAEYSLGIIYGSGKGVTRDAAEATRWIERAAAKGCEDAIAAVRGLKQLRAGRAP